MDIKEFTKPFEQVIGKWKKDKTRTDGTLFIYKGSQNGYYFSIDPSGLLEMGVYEDGIQNLHLLHRS